MTRKDCSDSAPHASAKVAQHGLMTLFIFAAISMLATSLSASESAVLPMQERAVVIDDIIAERVREVLPGLMQTHDLDLWLIISREYNEDPIIKTFLPSTWMAARRRTILMIHQPDEGPLETLAVARYDVGKTFKRVWDPETQPDQWQRLADLIAERDPKAIAVNTSDVYGLADGLNATELRMLTDALPDNLAGRITSAEPLAIGWLETRSRTELEIYPHIVKLAHEIIADAFSDHVITPGVTSTDDVRWWMRERIAELKLATWFHPSVSIQRGDDAKFDHLRTFDKQPDADVIFAGDLLHVDFGITYLRLNTDTQQHAYVLRPCETSAPDSLRQALKQTNRLQDILTQSFRTGQTGNEVLLKARELAISEGIRPSIYTHPIGFHGHGAGPAIGMWDNQSGTLANGNWPLSANTAFSIELNATHFIPEWDKDIRIMLEEDAWFDGDRVRYIHGRQTGFHLINQTDNTQLSTHCDP